MNSVVACGSCGASLVRPLSFEDCGPEPLASPALFRELALDRRKSRRETPLYGTPVVPAQQKPEPAWAEEAEAAAERVLHEEFEVGEWLTNHSAKETEVSPLERVLRFGEPIELDAPELDLEAAGTEEGSEEIATYFEQLTPPQPQPAQVREIRAVPATGGAQLGAWLIDAALLTALFAIYLVAAQAIVGHQAPSIATGFDGVLERAWSFRRLVLPGLALLAALSFVYSCLLHALGGRTLGKWLLGLTVVDTTGMPPPLARSAARSLLALSSLSVGFVFVLFDRRRQALHDKLTQTYVVRLAR